MTLTPMTSEPGETLTADCTRCGKPFYSDLRHEHEEVHGHLPEQHYHVVADLSGAGNEPVRIEIPEPVAQLIRAGALTLAIVGDPDQPRGLGLREITLTPPPPPPPTADDLDEADPTYLLWCLQCQTSPTAPMPFASEAERGQWAAEHTKGTGHDHWRTENTTSR